MFYQVKYAEIDLHRERKASTRYTSVIFCYGSSQMLLLTLVHTFGYLVK